MNENMNRFAFNTEGKICDYGYEEPKVLTDQEILEELNHWENMTNEFMSECQDLNWQVGYLQEQLDKAIVPKFKVGQEVWSIFISKYFTDCKEICNLEITAIMKCNNGIYYQGYVLEQGKNRSDYWFNEKNTFLTEEEARVKLKELQSE